MARIMWVMTGIGDSKPPPNFGPADGSAIVNRRRRLFWGRRILGFNLRSSSLGSHNMK